MRLQNNKFIGIVEIKLRRAPFFFFFFISNQIEPIGISAGLHCEKLEQEVEDEKQNGDGGKRRLSTRAIVLWTVTIRNPVGKKNKADRSATN